LRDGGGGSGGIPLGAIRTFADTAAQSGTAGKEQPATGELLPLAQQTALFSILGTNYGGNGINNFGLPNLAGTTMVGTGAGGPFNQIFDGETYGQHSVTLTSANLPTTIGGGGQSISNDQPSLGVTYLINVDGGGSGLDVPGMIVPFLGTFAPSGYLVAAGQVLSIADHPALFAQLGNTLWRQCKPEDLCAAQSAGPHCYRCWRFQPWHLGRPARPSHRVRHRCYHQARSAAIAWLRCADRQPSTVGGADLSDLHQWPVLSSGQRLSARALSETFLDDDSRGMFHNAHEYDGLYPDDVRQAARYCAPRRDDGYEVEAVRRRLAQRAGLAEADDGPRISELRGTIDHVGKTGIAGWAQHTDHPEAPVCLDIYADSILIGRTLANRYREDLEHAGFGSGCHGFEFIPPAGLAFAARSIEVRRSLDGTRLGVAAIVETRRATAR
jgi:microcystin-dependent protein